MRVGITSLSLLYVAAIAVSWAPGRIATPELLRLTALIVWNSSLLNGMAKFATFKDGLPPKRQIAHQV